MAGIGTVTYYDPETGDFGALGHGITDTDTALLMPFSSGSVLPSTVKAVKKGTAGSAGELRGDFDLTQDIGTLSANTTSGIFGTAETCPETWNSSQALPAASASEIQEGPAQILSNVEGDTVRSYDIEILNVNCGAADGRVDGHLRHRSGAHCRHRRHCAGHEWFPYFAKREDCGCCHPCAAE